MKKQAFTTVETQTFAPATSAAPDERREPVSLDGEDHPSEPETRGRAALRWFIDSFALASCGMAGVYGGVWLDPADDAAQPTRLRNVDREKQHHA